ncbi:hypothetical protein V3C99_014230 [Haemonchus contortus]
MLGQKSLLASQFIAILLFDSLLSEACSDCVTLAPGQGRIINFEVSGFVLPAKMVYSTNPKVQMQVPDISVTKEQALRTINSYVENLMHDTILNQIAVQSLSKEVLKQIQYMPATYDPLQCNDVAVRPSTTQVIEFDSEYSGSALNCIMNGVDDHFLNWCCRSKECSFSQSENSSPVEEPQSVPQEYVTYKGSLKVYNANVASWNSSTWDQISSEASLLMTFTTYSNLFSNAKIKII